MRYNKYRIPLFLCLLTPLGLFISFLAMNFPIIIEKYYSLGINKITRQLLNNLTGIFPFSVAEIVVLSLLIFVFYEIIKLIIHICSHRNKIMILFKFLLNTFALFSIIYFLFIFLWGINYYRQPFSKIAGLNSTASSVKELSVLCSSIINDANKLSLKINVLKDSKNTVAKSKNNKQAILKEVDKSYRNAAKYYKELDGAYGTPKALIFSIALSYSGISGIYFPFTGEANVNSDIPLSMFPNTACHEAAHQRGFAREDEANYISYFVCTRSTDIYFKYSGTLLALIYSMDALCQYDPESYKLLQTKYSKLVKADLVELNLFWKQYEGPIDKISSKINNAYLKANMQKDGIYSYGRMVDLLLAEFHAKLK